MDPTPSTCTKSAEEVKTHAFDELRCIAQQGDLAALYGTLDRAPKILDEIDKIPFVHTPLHRAVEFGHTNFAIEILTLKPSFGKKLNTNGKSPLHVAVVWGNRELAKRLVDFDRELIRVKGREGKTPLHCVAEAGDIQLLAEFLCTCPESIMDLTIRQETAFHVALKNHKVLAFKLIFEWIWRSYNGKLLNWKDDGGNTVLHIAVSTKQPEVVELLVRRAPIIIKEKNGAGETAFDIAEHEDWTIRNILLGLDQPLPRPRHTIKKDARSLDEFLLTPEPYFEKVVRFFLYCRRELSLDMRNMVLVVAVLIATATFEALDKSKNQSSNKTPTSTSRTNMTGLKAIGDMSYYLLNTITFTFSVAVMIVVMSFKPFTSFLHLSLVFLAISYGYKMKSISSWQTSFPISLIGFVYAFKLYFNNMDREIRMEMPAIWTGLQPRWKASPPVPVSLQRLRMVYRVMGPYDHH